MDTELLATIDELEKAISLLDKPTVRALSTRLIELLYRSDVPLPLPEAKRILNQLRRKRFFGDIEKLADALVQTGQTAGIVRRQYAQSLIDQGKLTAAESVLRELVRDTADDPGEHMEARGLLGRARKQRYVEARRGAGPHEAVAARDATVLLDAITIYHDAYQEVPDDCLWHGINAVACIARAGRDGITVPGDPHPVDLATEILSRIQAKGVAAPVWDQATALEANLALGDRHSAMGWALAYIRREDADAFEIGSTLRQLTEVWQLKGDEGDGQALLPILRDGLLKRETGRIELSAGEARMSNAELQKVLGFDAFVTIKTYRAGLDRARLVARIGIDTDRGMGTGFLVRGSDLAERFGDQWVLLTNAHVTSTKAEYKPAVAPEDAVVSFEAHVPSSPGQVDTYRIAKVLWESGPAELDTTVIELDRPVIGAADCDRCEIAAHLPVNDQKQRVYIIGHPSGGALSFSLQDNLLLDYRDPKMHYRAPTEGGSSGSPVFNSQWKLIGIHHAGSDSAQRLSGQPGTYAANEGIWLQSVRKALENG